MKLGTLIGTGVIIILGLIVLFGSIFIVQPGQQGLIFNSFTGLQEHTYREGMHLKTPLFEHAIKMNIRVQKQNEDAQAASKDLQDVSTTVAVNFFIEPDKLAEIYRSIGQSTTKEDYMQSSIMNPIIQETVKSVTARYTATELITKRSEVKNAIEDDIRTRMADYHINVTDVSITNFQFTKEFSSAIEQKVIAQQNAEKEQNNLAVVQFQAQQEVEKAKGQAQAIEIINKELEKSPQYVNYMMIEKWNGEMPLSLGSGSLLSISSGGLQ